MDYMFACKTFTLQELIMCSFGLRKTDYKVFEYLMQQKDRLTVQDISEYFGKERSTIQKALSNLLSRNLINRYQINMDTGGYVFTYKIKDKHLIKKEIHVIIDKWYKNIKAGIDRW